MRSFSEEDLRVCLHQAAEHDRSASPAEPRAATVVASRRPRRWLAPGVAAAAMLAIVVPISWVARGLPGAPDADPAGKGAEQVTTPVAPPTHAIESGLDLQRIFDAIGYPFRLDDGSGVAAVTEQEAIRLGQGDESLGLVWVGQRRAVGDNEATNGQATAWRLSWVIVAAATIHAFPGPSKYNAPSDTPSPNSALTQSVAFVDAITGNVYAGFVI